MLHPVNKGYCIIFLLGLEEYETMPIEYSHLEKVTYHSPGKHNLSGLWNGYKLIRMHFIDYLGYVTLAREPFNWAAAVVLVLREAESHHKEGRFTPASYQLLPNACHISVMARIQVLGQFCLFAGGIVRNGPVREGPNPW
jgi:hypothetical protein